MAKDKNNQSVELGDMLKFKPDRYTTKLGIIESFSTVSNDCAFVLICGGGGRGERMVTLSHSEKVNNG